MNSSIVNVNYRGCVNTTLDLPGKHCKHPVQLVIKDPKCTLVIFRNGKFRLMGCKTDDDIEAVGIAYKYFGHVPELILQSMTIKSQFHSRINLHKLSERIESQLELELFPALTITKYKPVKINVFACGTLIMCGIRDFQFSNLILQELFPLLCECTQL